jgi:hypothetical protein
MKIVSIEETHTGLAYVPNNEWVSTLYSGSISELNITWLINEGHIDPSNNLPLVSNNHVWRPYFCNVTKYWSYRR